MLFVPLVYYQTTDIAAVKVQAYEIAQLIVLVQIIETIGHAPLLLVNYIFIVQFLLL